MPGADLRAGVLLRVRGGPALSLSYNKGPVNDEQTNENAFHLLEAAVLPQVSKGDQDPEAHSAAGPFRSSLLPAGGT